jgi:acyl carrier protein
MGESRQEIVQWLIAWFAARSKVGEQPEKIDALCDIDFFQAGWLTSMETVELVTEVEQRFDMQFSDRDLQDPRFVTVHGLAELILETSPQMSGSR